MNEQDRNRKKKRSVAPRNNREYYEPSLLRVPPLSAAAAAHFEKAQAKNAAVSERKRSENSDATSLASRLGRLRYSTFTAPINVSKLHRDQERRGRRWEVFLEHFQPINGGKRIGAGAFGWVVVYRCIKNFETRVKDIEGKRIAVRKGELVAGKSGLWAESKKDDGTFDNEKRQDEKGKVRKEFWLMSSMNHPNVLKALEFFEDSGTYVILMEYISGGNIWELLSRETSYPESFVRDLVQQLISGMKHMHSCNIVHRDIKPQNLLVRKKTKSGQIVANLHDLPLKDLDVEVVVCDFGVSLALRPSDMSKQAITSFAGTIFTMAPEAFSDDYGKECDFYSIGVVTHMLLTGGEIPYGLAYGDTSYQAVICLERNLLDLRANYWGGVSEEARMFTGALLEKTPANRLDLDQKTVDHGWFKKKFTAKNDAQIQTKNLQRFVENMKNTAEEMCATFRLLYNPRSLEDRLHEIIEHHAQLDNDRTSFSSLQDSSADVAGLKMLIDLENTAEARELDVEITQEMSYDSALGVCEEAQDLVGGTAENMRAVYPQNFDDLRAGSYLEDDI